MYRRIPSSELAVKVWTPTNTVTPLFSLSLSSSLPSSFPSPSPLSSLLFFLPENFAKREPAHLTLKLSAGKTTLTRGAARPQLKLMVGSIWEARRVLKEVPEEKNEREKGGREEREREGRREGDGRRRDGEREIGKREKRRCKPV